MLEPTLHSIPAVASLGRFDRRGAHPGRTSARSASTSRRSAAESRAVDGAAVGSSVAAVGRGVGDQVATGPALAFAEGVGIGAEGPLDRSGTLDLGVGPGAAAQPARIAAVASTRTIEGVMGRMGQPFGPPAGRAEMS